MEGYRWKAAVVTLSDKGYAGEREEKRSPRMCEGREGEGEEGEKTVVRTDEKEERKKWLCAVCDK